MSDVIIVGDGPGGLSAALFLARADHAVVVFGQDKTAMHAAMLNNYLGLSQITGTDFQKVAREQARGYGASLVDARVERIEPQGDGFSVTLDGGESRTCSYLILSEGKSPRLATSLGAERREDGSIVVDHNGRTTVDRVYAVGRSTRPGRSQAIISAGDGAAAAIDILSREKGQAVCDWDVP